MRGSRDAPQTYGTGEGLLEAMQPNAQADVTGVWQSDRAIIAQALWHNTPESLHEKAPEVCAETGRVIASWVRLDNREALCAALKLEERPTLTDPQIILAAHRAWGQGCANRFEGDFSFVIYTPSTGGFFCARDSVGARPAFFFASKEAFIFSPSLAVLRTILDKRITPNQEWIAKYLGFAASDPDLSPYLEIERLKRAQWLEGSVEGALRQEEYFRFDQEAEPYDGDEEKWYDAYREAFDLAVKRRLRSAFRVASELSGGLDSGAIVASTRHQSPETDLLAFGHAYHVNDGNALIQSAMHFGVDQVRVQTLPKSSAAPLLRSGQGMPTLGVSLAADIHGYNERMFAECAQAGSRTVLSGYGGDQLATARVARYAIAMARKRGDVRALWEFAGGNAALRAARVGKWSLAELHPLEQREAFKAFWLQGYVLRSEAAHEFGVIDRLWATKCAVNEASTINQALLAHFDFSLLLCERMEQSSHHALLKGVELRYPMLDRQFMIQVLRTPERCRAHRGIDRLLHKKGLAAYLPDEITSFKKNDGGQRIAPWPWQRSNDQRRHDLELDHRLEELVDLEAIEKMQSRLLRISKGGVNGGDKLDIRAVMSDWFLRNLTLWLQSL
ncbi:MAG: asparagine synthase-related protein [Pseudomonadota bacterium]